MLPLLDPVLIAVFPRWNEATGVVCDMLRSWPQGGFAVALAEDDRQASHFRNGWPEDSLHPLLLLRTRAELSLSTGLDAVSEIMSRQPRRPLAVLIADGPSLPDFVEAKRSVWNREFSRLVAGHFLDVQVFEYAPSWSTAPPRVR